MKWKRSPELTSLCLLGSLISLSGCGAANVIEIPDSLKEPCVSTVDVSQAQTVGDLGKAIIQQDSDLRVCDIKREAVVTIAEAGRRPWWRVW